MFYNEHIFSSIDQFFFGIGLQDFQGKILAIHNVEINVPHNGIQEIWVAWGLIGTVLFIFMLLSLVKIAKKLQPKPDKRQFLPLGILLFYIQW